MRNRLRLPREARAAEGNTACGWRHGADPRTTQGQLNTWPLEVARTLRFCFVGVGC